MLLAPKIKFTPNNSGEFTGNPSIRLDARELNRLLLDESVPIVTHSGTFHADEIFTIALIKLMRRLYKVVGEGYDFLPSDNSEIIRVSDIQEIKIDNWQKNAIVVDLLGGHYDHHMAAEMRPYRNYPYVQMYGDHSDAKLFYASFGSLWKDVSAMFEIGGGVVAKYHKPKHQVGSISVGYQFDRRFIMPVDLQDNYGPNIYANPTSKIVGNYNNWSSVGDDGELTDDGFGVAVDVAFDILFNELHATQKKVIGIMKCASKGFEITNNGVVYFENGDLIEKSAIESVCIEMVEGNELDCMVAYTTKPSPRDGSFNVTTCNEWEFDVENIKYNNPEGLVFIHPDGFLATFSTIESAKNFVNGLRIKVRNGSNQILSLTPIPPVEEMVE